MAVDRSQPNAKVDEHKYEELEQTVALWGVKKFEHFRGDVSIKQKNKKDLTQFELDCSAVFPQLATWVRHREEVSDDVFFLDSERFHAACPGNFDEHASAYAKGLRVVRWSQKQRQVISLTVEQWLDGDEHERSSLLLFGQAEIGKSKLAHLLAQETRGSRERERESNQIVSSAPR
eukprot:15471169-Alexandrium_andersonii.AAC.1